MTESKNPGKKKGGFHATARGTQKLSDVDVNGSENLRSHHFFGNSYKKVREDETNKKPLLRTYSTKSSSGVSSQSDDELAKTLTGTSTSTSSSVASPFVEEAAKYKTTTSSESYANHETEARFKVSQKNGI